MDYRISGDRMKGFADQARRLGKVSGELTPVQIEDTLKGVTAGGGNASTFIVSARAYFPTVKKAQASNVLTIPVTTSAIGGIKNDS